MIHFMFLSFNSQSVATTVSELPLLDQSKSYFVHSTSQCWDISQVQLDWLSGRKEIHPRMDRRDSMQIEFTGQ
ncbi:hypothetical protein EYF80_012850 [Liparis tanakae]|uniref:Uncharacterized protein n=1 Tax=Liparis tanakae TaxID=230148 RepID=A0A4Z2IHS6_9TELE|nr:hypothetical protein EYF80_012850 [Liparis tanakae]